MVKSDARRKEPTVQLSECCVCETRGIRQPTCFGALFVTGYWYEKYSCGVDWERSVRT